MNLFIYIFGFNLFSVVSYFIAPYDKINNKEKFPFKNYFLVSTRISKFSKKVPTRLKREAKNCDERINLKFSNNDYKMCINSYNISNYGTVNEETKFIVCNQNTTNTYKINQLEIKFVKGYIINKPSAFSGYINNNNLYGKIEMDSRMFYIDPLDNFPLLMSKALTENAVIYEIPLQNTNFSSSYNKKSFTFTRKRSIRTETITAGRLCSLMVIIDNSFLQIVGKNNIKSSIRTVLHSLDLANALFRITDFNNNGISDNIGFITKYVIVLESEYTGMNKLPLYTKYPIDGKLYLFFLSQYDLLAEVCLGVAFTAQPFMHRVLGLSYTGVTEDFIYPVPTNNTGGICERPSRKEGEGSYNNLVITYRLENDESVPQITSDLSLVHELGHSFGSDHDKIPECMGYLMAPHTFNNTFGHNFMFSSCSKKQIDGVVKIKGSCLDINPEPFCGNGLVEGNEDCDCGLSFTCINKDQCCIARNSPIGPPCTVNKNAGFDCHPSQGLCCTSDCRLRNISHLSLNCENFSKQCPCSNSDENCSCGIQGSCIEDECHSIECTRIGAKECKCNNQKQCITCCIGSKGQCLSSKILTKKYANKSEINIDKLNHHSVSTNSFLKAISGNYEEYCRETKCVTLLFRTFNKGSFCLFKGKLGVCQDDYVCDTRVGAWSRLPENIIVKANSIIFYPNVFCTLIFVLLLFCII